VKRIYYWKKLFFGLLLCSLWLLQSCEDVRKVVSYTTFRRELEKGNISSVTISGDEITGKFRKPIESTISDRSPLPGTFEGWVGYPQTDRSFTIPDFVTFIPSIGDPGLWPLIEKNGVEVKARPKSNMGWGNISSFLFFLVFLGFGFVILRRMRVQRPDIFSSSNLTQLREYTRGGKKVSFRDVAGSEGAKAELQEIVDFLKNPQRFQRLGGRVPKGALLIGPPGTGKTLLARAVAGEAGVPFFSISGSDFMEMYVGVGASRVRSMFRKAKAKAPSILFIDELDSIGAQRGLGYGGGYGEREQTLNQLLSEMDGFEINDQVIVMAATNRPDILDPALLRPGRFDRHINVDLPSLDERLAILELHSRNKPLGSGMDLRTIARSTPSFSGADLENLLNEAAILAARSEKNAIDAETIQQARDKIIMGLERKNLHIGEEELKTLAYHEGGHALVAALLPNTEPLYKVTIIPRGRAMGMTQQLPEEKYIYSKDYVSARLAVMLGGRAAERLVFNTSTSGSEQDLKEATTLARRMVLDWGMSEHLSNVAFGGQRQMYMDGSLQQPLYSETTATKIDTEIDHLIEEAFNQATELLKGHRNELDRVAALLIEREEIPGSDVLEFLKNQGSASDDRSPGSKVTVISPPV
jgi:cell division protease FtsH